MGLEKLTENIYVCSSEEHRFGTDAFLLADFAAPRKRDIVCDLGTGCGIIPFVMSRYDPPKRIYAVEIQENGIEQLKAGLAASKIENEIIPIHADLREWEDCPKGTLDLVTCNPPYKAAGCGLESEIGSQRIARHEVSCSLDDVCRAAAKMLRFGGRLCICNRPERLCDAMSAMRENGIEPKRLRFVAKSPSDAPWLFLLEGRRGGNPFLNVLPTLFTRDERGEYSAEMKRIYRLEE